MKKFYLTILIIMITAVIFTACNRNNPLESSEAASQTPSADFETDGAKSVTFAGNEEGAEKYPKQMYVNSIEGLRVRSSPDINGERIGLLPHLAEITVINEDINDITIDNIKGKWVLMQFATRLSRANGSGHLEGWVFNGYLADWSHDDFQKYLDEIDFGKYFQSDNARKITGNSSSNNNFTGWAPGNSWVVYYFGLDGKYSSGLLETSFGTGGTWQVKENLLILSEIESGDYDRQIHEPPVSYIYKFIVFGNNTLLMRSENLEDKSTQIFFRN